MSDLFSGTDDAITALTNTIENGHLIAGSGATPEVNVDTDTEAGLEASIAKALFGYVIPPAWKLTGIYPVIITIGYPCVEINENNAGAHFLRYEVAVETQFCYNDKLYFLVYPDGEERSGAFKKPPGVDSLKNGAYGGLLVDDLIIGSINSFEANGNQNGGAELDPNNSEDLARLMSADIRAAGYLNIPICSGVAADVAWSEHNEAAANYPCNVPTGISDCGDSTFVDQTSDASPDVADCEQIIENIIGFDGKNKGEWEVENVLHQQHQLVEFGSCRFGVQGNGGSNPGYHIGAEDIISIIRQSISEFGGSGKVGAKGDMVCNGYSSGSVNVAWGLY